MSLTIGVSRHRVDLGPVARSRCFQRRELRVQLATWSNRWWAAPLGSAVFELLYLRLVRRQDALWARGACP